MAELALGLFTSIGSAVSSGVSAVGSGLGAIGGPVTGVGTAGSTIASILQGTATALSVFAGIGAANQEADKLELAASDAEREKAMETLQGVSRRTSIRRALQETIGDQNTAYAASGVDLTFGTPSQARKEAFREADLGLETAVGTEQTRIARLDERAANLRARAKSTRRAGVLSGIGAGIGGAADILNRG